MRAPCNARLAMPTYGAVFSSVQPGMSDALLSSQQGAEESERRPPPPPPRSNTSGTNSCCCHGCVGRCAKAKADFCLWTKAMWTSSYNLRRERAELVATRDVMLNGSANSIMRLLLQYEHMQTKIHNEFLDEYIRHKIKHVQKMFPEFAEMRKILSQESGSTESELGAIVEEDHAQGERTELETQQLVSTQLVESEFESQQYKGTANLGRDDVRDQRRATAKRTVTGSVDDVAAWVRNSSWYWTDKNDRRLRAPYAGADEIANLFRKEEIDGPALMAYLDGGREELKQLGMSVGNATKMIAGLRELKKEAADPGLEEMSAALAAIDRDRLDTYGRASAESLINFDVEIARLENIIVMKEHMATKALAMLATAVYLVGQYEFADWARDHGPLVNSTIFGT